MKLAQKLTASTSDQENTELIDEAPFPLPLPPPEELPSPVVEGSPSPPLITSRSVAFRCLESSVNSLRAVSASVNYGKCKGEKASISGCQV